MTCSVEAFFWAKLLKWEGCSLTCTNSSDFKALSLPTGLQAVSRSSPPTSGVTGPAVFHQTFRPIVLVNPSLVCPSTNGANDPTENGMGLSQERHPQRRRAELCRVELHPCTKERVDLTASEASGDRRRRHPPHSLPTSCFLCNSAPERLETGPLGRLSLCRPNRSVIWSLQAIILRTLLLLWSRLVIRDPPSIGGS